jgi:hypothetical protein
VVGWSARGDNEVVKLPILTSRSHIEAFEKCPRKNFWQYHYAGVGLEPSDERGLKLDARIGTATHDGIEFGLKHNADAAMAAGYGAGRLSLALGESGIDVPNLPEQQRNEVYEAVNIVTALVYAWLRLRLPYMLSEGEIIAVEKEMAVDFRVGDDVVRLMARPDIVWRRRSDGAIFIRNLKTVRDPGTIWREQWGLDMQTLTEPLAVDEWLNKEAYTAGEGLEIPATCMGVIIDGLTTGAVLDYPKGSGKYYHNTPLLYAWHRAGDAPVTPDEWYARYEWSCADPHKMSNGHRCPGGRSHKLSGVHKESVTKYPGGILAWVDHLLDTDRALVENEIIELPPIIRSPYAIERWKHQVLQREVDIYDYADMVEIGRNSLVTTMDEQLDKHFPMNTASGNCLRPGRCFAYDLCWGSAAADPLMSGYKLRTPHHEEEKLQHEESNIRKANL